MKKTISRILAATASFTLVELLVVIAIIGILAGIALPVFSKVQERAKATQEANNLRQIGLATAGYLNDNGNQIFSTGTSWVSSLYPTYAAATKIFMTPFDTRFNSASTSPPFPVSFGVNGALITTSGFAGNMDKLSYASTDFCYAPAVLSTTGSFADNSGNNTSSLAPVITQATLPTGGTGKFGTFSNRSSITVLYADWHVQAIPYTTTYATGTTSWTPQ